MQSLHRVNPLLAAVCVQISEPDQWNLSYTHKVAFAMLEWCPRLKPTYSHKEKS